MRGRGGRRKVLFGTNYPMIPPRAGARGPRRPRARRRGARAVPRRATPAACSASRAPRGPRRRTARGRSPASHHVAPAPAHGPSPRPACRHDQLLAGGELGGELGDRVRARQVDREQPVVPRRAPHRAPVRVAARDPDRDPRGRLELAAPVRDELLKPLVEQPSPLALVLLLAEALRVELAVPVPAEADAEHEPPAVSRSSVAVSRASLCGRRRAIGVTSGPIVMRSVLIATAASVIHGSATSRTSGRRRGPTRRTRPSRPPRPPRRAPQRARDRPVRRTGREDAALHRGLTGTPAAARWSLTSPTRYRP